MEKQRLMRAAQRGCIGSPSAFTSVRARAGRGRFENTQTWRGDNLSKIRPATG